MFCSKCGKEVSDDANFCKYCGHSFDEEKVTDKLEKTTENKQARSDVDKVEEVTNIEGTAIQENVPLSNIPPANPVLEEENFKKGDIIGRKVSRRQRIKKQREIEDQRSLEAFTVHDDAVLNAPLLDKDRITLKDRGTLVALKTKEIVYVVLSVLIMIASAVLIALIRANNEVNDESMGWLVVVGYFLFFVIFAALATGVDRLYNLLTLFELGVRKVTLKKYGWRMQPLVLQGTHVLGIDISGECDMCNGENKGTYHIEWHDDTLIAVCNYNRQHLYRINIEDIVGEEDDARLQATEDKQD